MKRRSDTSFRRPPEPTFFTDRDLGKTFPEVLRDAGLLVVRYSDHYREQVVADHEWIRMTALKGWVALSHDRNVLSDQLALQAALGQGARLFIIRGKGLTAREMAEVSLDGLPAVHRALARQAAGFIAVVARRSVGAGRFKTEVSVRRAEGLA